MRWEDFGKPFRGLHQTADFADFFRCKPPYELNAAKKPACSRTRGHLRCTPNYVWPPTTPCVVCKIRYNRTTSRGKPSSNAVGEANRWRGRRRGGGGQRHDWGFKKFFFSAFPRFQCFSLLTDFAYRGSSCANSHPRGHPTPGVGV